MCGFLYLLAYGYIAVIVYMQIRNPKMRGLGMLLGLFAMFTMPVFLVIFGFLYITTDVHQRLMEGVANAKESQ